MMRQKNRIQTYYFYYICDFLADEEQGLWYKKLGHIPKEPNENSTPLCEVEKLQAHNQMETAQLSSYRLSSSWEWTFTLVEHKTNINKPFSYVLALQDISVTILNFNSVHANISFYAIIIIICDSDWFLSNKISL